MCNVYLVLAYGLLWSLFMLYAWMIHRRQEQLEKELEELKKTFSRR